jgi:hypothetical protein
MSLSPSRRGMNQLAIAPIIMNNAATLSLVHFTALVLRRCVQHSKNETSSSSHHMTIRVPTSQSMVTNRLRLKCDGTRAETRLRLSAKRTNTFKSEGVSVQSTTGSRGLGFGGSNAGYTTFRGSVKSTGYPLHSPVSPSLPLPCVACAITFQLGSTTTGPNLQASKAMVTS